MADVRAVLLQALYFMRNLAVQVVEKIALMPQAGRCVCHDQEPNTFSFGPLTVFTLV